ncbi:MAG TPA: XRE family transcriptional regulator [Polyangia bacterium]|nr:XRE family transcriptional regulator [Polyangia bacterium]
MSPAQLIAITPSLLTWAREESGYDPAGVAKRMQVKEERLLSWESGERQPTLKQVENLARVLHRPLSVFFMPQPPQLPPLAAEYRRLPGIEPGGETPEFRLAIRQMVARRENTLNLMGELGDSIADFALRAHLRETPADVGRRLREATGVDVALQLGWPDEWKAWAAWRAAVERLGVLVFQFGRVKVEETRGVALLRSPLPAVGINTKEIPEAKTYTLLHEVVHLMLAAGHEETSALKEKRSEAEWTKVERFAEVAASHAAVPEEALQAMVKQLGFGGGPWDIARVRRVARPFKITPSATATRLRESGFMTWAGYERWRSDWEAHVATLPPRRGGIATPAQKAINKAGRPFAQLVLEALAANRLTAVDAARYLDLKFEHFDKLRKHLSISPGEIALDG